MRRGTAELFASINTTETERFIMQLTGGETARETFLLSLLEASENRMAQESLLRQGLSKRVEELEHSRDFHKKVAAAWKQKARYYQRLSSALQFQVNQWIAHLGKTTT